MQLKRYSIATELQTQMDRVTLQSPHSSWYAERIIGALIATTTKAAIRFSYPRGV